MWQNRQETGDLVTFTEKSLMENFIFCAVLFVYTQRTIQDSCKHNIKSFETVSSQNQQIIVAKLSMLDISGSQWYASVHIYLKIPKDRL